MFTALRPLIVKELLAVWRDPKSRFVLILPPIIQLLIFSFAATQEVRNVTLAVLDQDRTAISRELIARFEGSPTFTEILRLDHDAQVAPTIDAKDALVLVRIGQDFSQTLLAGKPATVQMILDGRRSNAALIVQSYIGEIVERFNVEWSAARGLPSQTTQLVSRAWFNPNLFSRWSIVPGLVAVLTLMIGLLVTALSVARERELGTFEQLLVTPYTPARSCSARPFRRC